MIGKKEAAAQLKEAAQLLEVLGEDPFRARAFASAARACEAFEGDFDAAALEGGLTRLRGVGAATAAELRLLVEQGVMPALAELRARVPEGVRELFAVAGLGPKRIGALWRAGITGLDELVRAGEEDRLAALPGFGRKSAGSVVAAARFVLAARQRMRLDEAERLSAALLEVLRAELPEAVAAVAGEQRRALETVGELELVVAGADGAELRPLLGRLLDEVDADALAGSLMGKRVRFTLAPWRSFGAALALRTGSDEFVEALRRSAAAAGFALGVELPPRLELPLEEALFEFLDLPWVPPELRESADAEPVPGLLEAREVRGLVHNHSTWSDALFSIREMVAAARARGYGYLAMADHSRSSYYANGLSIERVREQAAEIREIRAELAADGSDFGLLHGIEVDILSDGSLDYPDEVLAELDYTVVSVHQNFGLPRDEQTERMVRAVRHPLASILGHATGRLLLRRPGYEVDLERVLGACAEAGTVVEINANPRRLDLDWRWLRRARELGCRFSIDPDAHHVDGFDDVRYGVMMARKGGLTAADVVNCAPDGEAFLRLLKPR